MFYAKDMENALRFGDVLQGYVSATPSLEKPISGGLQEGCKVDVNLPKFSVNLSPCCSIGHRRISLTPLIEVRSDFFDNPYFAEDLTRINRKMEPRQSVAPYKWDAFDQEEKDRRLAEGRVYACLEVFIYEGHEMFPPYTVHRRQGDDPELNTYMIDFGNTYNLNCEKIVSPKQAPLESRCLQLTVEARCELRDKVASYYTRIPKEEEALAD
jgi:hypothetical protein